MEETKEVSKPARKKPVRNKTKVVPAAPDLGDMEGVDEDMRKAMIVAAMADAENDTEKGDSKEESDIYLNTKDLKEAMAGIGGDTEADDGEESKVESKVTKKIKEKKETKAKAEKKPVFKTEKPDKKGQK